MDTETVLTYWENARKRTMRYVEDLPADLMSFQPSEEVFNFSKQILHIISWERIMFSRLLDSVPIEDELSENEVKKKEELQKVMEIVTNETKGKLKQMKENEWEKDIVVDGRLIPFKKVFLDLIEHEAHHRGQLVVYYRLLQLQPPSYLEEESLSNQTDLFIRPYAETFISSMSI